MKRERLRREQSSIGSLTHLAISKQLQEVINSSQLVGVLGGVLFQFALALESFVTDKPVLSDSLKDKEAALKLFCDWLRSE